MKATSVKHVGTRPDGSRIVEVLIVSDETPDNLPTTGEGVEGLCNDDTFAPFSMLYVVGDAATKVFIANESGVFIPQ